MDWETKISIETPYLDRYRNRDQQSKRAAGAKRMTRRSLASHAPAAPVGETLVWTFGANFTATPSTPNPEDINAWENERDLAQRTNSWPGGPITTTCGFRGGLAPVWSFDNRGVPELEGEVWFDAGAFDYEIHIPSVQAGSGWRLYVGWGSEAVNNIILDWKDGVDASASSFTPIGNYTNLPANSYAHINDARFASPAAWLAAYDDNYLPITITDQGANTGLTLRVTHNGTRIRWCCLRVRNFIT